MNKIKRILSIILCISMLLPLFQDLVMFTSAEDDPVLNITLNGEKVSNLNITQSERFTLTAKASKGYGYSYQWQILIDPMSSVWANIYDLRSSEAEVHYALICTLLDSSDSAYLRCKAVSDDSVIYSDPVCVTVIEKMPVAEENVKLSVSKLMKSAPLMAAPNGDDDDDDEPEYVNFTINYLSADNPTHKVYQSYTSKIAANAVFSQNVISPTQIGFAPFYTGSTGSPVLAEGGTVTVTHDGEEREYTYTGGSYMYDGAAETDSDWLAAIEIQVIADTATTAAGTIAISFDPDVDSVEDVVYNVYYKAIQVPFSVKYYFQNINDDAYTQNAAISYNGMALTGTIVDDDTLYNPVLEYFGVTDPNADYGFSPLYHYPESVAADGSTVFECYYDRNYYLMKFDMDGGYGVEPIYARYGASFVVTPPTKPGYVFKGWDKITHYEYKVYADNSKETYLTTVTLDAGQYALNGSPSAYSESFDFGGTTYPNAYFVFESSGGDGSPDVATANPFNFTGTIQAGSVSYKAIWETVSTTYTIVYWAENADDNGYSYWGNKSVSALSSTVLTNFDAIVSANPASGVPLTDAQHFTYNSVKTKFINGDGVIVEGDGSTIINVYYSRNTYDILFYDSVGSCHIPVHVHSVEAGCYEYDCTSAHVHTADCCIYGLTEAPHTEQCCSIEEHVHSEACLIDNCPLTEHTHTADCYICVGYEHTHTDECCSKEVHVHTADCCSLTAHTHGDGNCNYLTCTQEEHKHSISCYTNQTGYTIGSNASDNQGRGVMTAINNPQAGHVYRYRRNNTNNNYIWFYDGYTWYYLGTGNYRGISGYGNLATPSSNGSWTVSSGAATMNCVKTEHTHTGTCYECGSVAHTHSTSCYPGATADRTSDSWYANRYNNGRPTSNLSNGQVYVYNYYGTPYKSIYIGGTWYIYDGNVASGNKVSANCGLPEHTHTGNCCIVPEHTHGTGSCVYGCGKTPHTHDDGTCTYTKCGLVNHTHTDDCYNCNNTGTKIDEHTHSDACQYKCGMLAHKHDASCCILEAHIHSNACAVVGGSYRNSGNGYYFKLSSTSVELSNATAESVNGITLYYNSKASTNEQYLFYKIGDHYFQLLYGTNSTITRSNYTGNTGRYSTLTIRTNCTKEEHIHDVGECICPVLEHEHTDSCYDCGKIVHTHGDGTCNVAGCTDPTHHVHTEECLNCGFDAEHVHTADCPKNLICTQAEHTHDSTCQLGTRYLVYKITAKYNADIHNYWPATDPTNGKVYSADAGYRWDPQNNNIGFEQVLVYIDRMPGMANESGHSLKLVPSTSSANTIDMHYCVQTIPGDTTAEYKNYQGNTATVETGSGGANGYQFVTDYRFAQAKYTGITTDVDFIDLEGFTKYWLYTNGGINKAYSYSTQTQSGTQDYFYYLRNQYNLSFYNYNADWGTVSRVYYEENMNPYNPGEPPYPSSLEPNAYRFDGWCTTPECYAGTEFDWTVANKMPAKDVKLYAKWAPVSHTVRFFETYDDMLAYEASVQAGTPDESLVYKHETVPNEYTREVEHGTAVGSLPNPDKLLVTNPNGSTSEYDFGGWFFVENENKKAYTPLDMPITNDLNVFADWGTHTAQPYAVHYALDVYETNNEWLARLGTPSALIENKEFTVFSGDVHRTYICLNDGTDSAPLYRWHRVISDVTRGYAYQGTTRTFAARAGDTYHQLYDAYDIDFNAYYYPTPASHSITMVYEENSLEPIYNVFTFRYVYVENVDYVVRYLDASTGEVLHEPKYETTQNAVVTERFVPITDYVPDAFYKQCILAVVEDPDNPGTYLSSPENVITFYYSKNDTSARYTVHFMLQKSDDDSSVLTDADYVISFNEDGTYNFSDKFEESGSLIDGIADKNTATPINPIVFSGFDLVENKAVYADGAGTPHSVAYLNGVYTITPKVEGTDLFIFYTREQYKYKVYYLRYGSPVSTTDLAGYTTAAADENNPKLVLADTDGLDPNNYLYALYGRDFTATAKDINGYVCVSETEQSKPITPNEASNYIIFFYTPEQYTVQYEVVGDIGGTLSNTIETFAGTEADSIEGSTATADSGYRFVGWFVDEECTVPATFDGTSNPGGKGTTYSDSTKTAAAEGETGLYVYPDVTKLIPNGQTGDDTNIFYAKFEPLAGDLKITRANSANEGNGNQVFVYEISDKDGNKIYVSITGNGSVTVHDLLFGDYTVTQMNDWSHRFGDEAQTVTLNQPTGTEVTFDDDAISEQWLNGNGSVAKNVKEVTE